MSGINGPVDHTRARRILATGAEISDSERGILEALAAQGETVRLEVTLSPEVLSQVSGEYVEHLRDSQRQIDSYSNGGYESWHSYEAEIVGILQGDGAPNAATFVPWFLTGYRVTSMHGNTIIGVEPLGEAAS